MLDLPTLKRASLTNVMIPATIGVDADVPALTEMAPPETTRMREPKAATSGYRRLPGTKEPLGGNGIFCCRYLVTVAFCQ
jgi:hypothetical protein